MVLRIIVDDDVKYFDVDSEDSDFDLGKDFILKLSDKNNKNNVDEWMKLFSMYDFDIRKMYDKNNEKYTNKILPINYTSNYFTTEDIINYIDKYKYKYKKL